MRMKSNNRGVGEVCDALRAILFHKYLVRQRPLLMCMWSCAQERATVRVSPSINSTKYLVDRLFYSRIIFSFFIFNWSRFFIIVYESPSKWIKSCTGVAEHVLFWQTPKGSKMYRIDCEFNFGLLGQYRPRKVFQTFYDSATDESSFYLEER